MNKLKLSEKQYEKLKNLIFLEQHQSYMRGFNEANNKPSEKKLSRKERLKRDAEALSVQRRLAFFRKYGYDWKQRWAKRGTFS